MASRKGKVGVGGESDMVEDAGPSPLVGARSDVDGPGPDTPLLEASEVSKRYGERVALDRVSMVARRGEMVACIGPNGAGKTTLLTILAGVQEADGGTVTRPDGHVGWVPQQPAVYGKLTVAENLRLFARLDGVRAPEEAVERMLRQTGLEERAGEQASRLSGGNRQRLNIAVGLLSDPSVLLLDEPSAALDPRQRERLWSFVRDLAARGTSVVYSTHQPSEAEAHADRVLVLADGERLFWGTPRELRDAVPVEGDPWRDLETAFVEFLRRRGH